MTWLQQYAWEHTQAHNVILNVLQILLLQAGLGRQICALNHPPQATQEVICGE